MDKEGSLRKRFGRLTALVVDDWNIPEINGLDLLKWIRARAPTSDLPFLMITAESSQEGVFLALEARVSEYIVKPFSAATVIQKICQMLSTRAEVP